MEVGWSRSRERFGEDEDAYIANLRRVVPYAEGDANHAGGSGVILTTEVTVYCSKERDTGPVQSYIQME